jgi:hypothetical protein
MVELTVIVLAATSLATTVTGPATRSPVELFKRTITCPVRKGRASSTVTVVDVAVAFTFVSLPVPSLLRKLTSKFAPALFTAVEMASVIPAANASSPPFLLTASARPEKVTTWSRLFKIYGLYFHPLTGVFSLVSEPFPKVKNE